MAFTWTDEYTTRLILAVLDQVIRLRVSYDGTFKKAVWTRIEREFNRSQPDGDTLSRKQLQSKVTELKKTYKTYAAMKNNSGFGWDPQTNLPTAPESVWGDIIAEHPQVREFKTRPLIMYAELDQMFLGLAATDDYASYMASQASRSRTLTLPGFDSDSRAESVCTTNLNIGNEDEVDSVASNGDGDERTNVVPSPLTSTQGASDNDGSAKRYKSAGEKMTETILVLADAHKTLAVTSAARQASDRRCKLSRSDVAIKEFKGSRSR